MHSVDYNMQRPSPANTLNYRPLSILEDFDSVIDLGQGGQARAAAYEQGTRSRGSLTEEGMMREEGESRR